MEVNAEYSNQIQTVKRRRRKRNYSLVILTGLIVVFVIFAVLSCTVLFRITEIEVIGSSVYDFDTIAEATGIMPGEALLTLKTRAVSKMLTDSFIYIDGADIHKRFPNTLTVEITPSVPAASVQQGDGYIYLSTGGKVLELNPLPKADTLIFTGVSFTETVTPGGVLGETDADRQTVRTVLEIANGDLGGLSPKTDYIDITDRGNIKIMYDNRIELNIGGLSDIAYKLKFLKEIIDTKIGPNTSGRLMMLSSGGASFIDSDGQEYNEKKFEANLTAQAASETAENSETEVSETSSETQ
jgi:cell division septal protein FtsQ